MASAHLHSQAQISPFDRGFFIYSTTRNVATTGEIVFVISNETRTWVNRNNLSVTRALDMHTAVAVAETTAGKES
jgi:hypothetical protein